MDAPPTLSALFQHYLDDTLLGKAPWTRYQYQLLHRRLLRLFGDLPLCEVTPDLLRMWKAHLARKNKSGTVYCYMKMLSAVLRVAVEELEWLPVHPMAKLRKPSPSPGVVRFLSADERVALLAACQASPHPLLYVMVLLALSTGGRKNEIRCLAWSAVDVEAGTVRFLRTKTYTARTVPVLGDALQVLRELWLRRRLVVPWVFSRGDGLKPVLIETAWRAARLASGVQNFRFHDLRHSYASYLAMSGASLQDISTLLGHKKLQMTLRYTHLLPSHTRGVVEAMVGKFLV